MSCSGQAHVITDVSMHAFCRGDGKTEFDGFSHESDLLRIRTSLTGKIYRLR